MKDRSDFEVMRPLVAVLFLAVVGLSLALSVVYQGYYNPDDISVVGRSLDAKRSPKWPRARAEYLLERPACEACGASHDTQVHHVVPFHVSPKLELEKSNLIGLCGPHGCNAHFRIGHLRNWNKANPNVWVDAKAERSRNFSRE